MNQRTTTGHAHHWKFRDVHTSPHGYAQIVPGNSPDEGVHFRGLDIIQLLDSVFDLSLVRLDISDEDQSVMFLNLLHCRLCVQRPAIRQSAY